MKPTSRSYNSPLELNLKRRTMKLVNTFDVAAPLAEAWPLLNDLQTVADCMPGAQLDSVEGNAFAGTMKMKLGALSLQFRGSGMIVERDEASHRMVITGRGKDAKGTGTADANVSVALTESPDKRTAVAVETDLNVSGRLAQLGHSAMRDVGDRMAQQFATALEERLTQNSAATEHAAPSAAASASGAIGAVRSTQGTEPLDLADVLGETPKRVVIAVVSLVLGLAAGRFLFRKTR
jgi:uncharacterized protein